MILVKFSGGLGNQIFQYGLYLELCKRYPDIKVKGDIYTYTYQDVHYGFELDRIFRLREKGLLEIASRKDYYKVTGTIAPTKLAPVNSFREKVLAFTNARLREHHYHLVGKHLIQEAPNDMNFEIVNRDEWEKELQSKLFELDTEKDWYVDGYWQATCFFEHALNDVIKNLNFPKFDDEINIEYEKIIQKTESVSIHVRRGDYVGTIFDVLGTDYYKRAVEDVRIRLQKRDKIPTFFVFSEDSEYVEKHFEWLGDYHLITHNTGVNSFRDLQLMSLCKHQITANSSFSAWSGYFNPNPEKLVYYPEQYSTESSSVNKTQQGWIMIPEKYGGR